MKTDFEIIPAIDLIDGQCVRLTEGDYTQKKVYNRNPLDVALNFEAAGIKRLHLVDLDGAKAGKVVNWTVLESITRHTGLSIDFGGGVKTEEDVKRILDSGAHWVTVGSIAVKDENRLLSWFERYGAEKFFLGADVKQEKIAVGGWLETTSIDLLPFLSKYQAHGVQYLFCTDVSKDGKMEGPSIALYRKIIQSMPGIQLVASGGVSSMADVYALKDLGCKGVILGKAIYEGRVRLEELV